MHSKITLKDVSLRVPVYEAKDEATQAEIASFLTHNYFARLNRRQITLLEGLNCDFKSGDRIGVLGENGAGKSTFLRVLAGSYMPTSGTCDINGQVSAFFNIGLGFESDSSGYNNIILRSLAMGRSYKQAKAVVPDILEFTKLGAAIKRPMGTYSHGMRLRLAFAILTAHEHDIMLLDEWIGAGDKRFTDVAQQRLNDRVKKSNLMVVATHNRRLIKEVCTKCVIFDKGRIIYQGGVDDAVDFYENEIVTPRARLGENLKTSEL